MTARSAYKVCKAALKQRDPATTVLFSSEDVIYNKNFHIACPFNHDSKNPFDCQPKYILKAPCSSIISRLDMPRHLRDVHHVYRANALKIVAEIRRCLKHSEKSTPVKLNRNLFDKHDNIIETGEKIINARVNLLRRQSHESFSFSDRQTNQTAKVIEPSSLLNLQIDIRFVLVFVRSQIVVI